MGLHMVRFNKAFFLSLLCLLLYVPLFPHVLSAGVEWEKQFRQRDILAYCSNYNTMTSPYAHFYYTEEDSDYIMLIQQATDEYYPLLAKDFGLTEIPRALIIIFPDKHSFAAAVNYQGDNVPMGLYYKGILHLLSPRHLDYSGNASETEIKSRFLKEGALFHELTHYVMDIKTTRRYETWFNEGVALYYEYKYTNTEWRPDLKEESAAISLEDLHSHFNRLPKNMAYRRSFDAILNYVNEHGEQNLQALIQ